MAQRACDEDRGGQVAVGAVKLDMPAGMPAYQAGGPLQLAKGLAVRVPDVDGPLPAAIFLFPDDYIFHGHGLAVARG